MYNRNVISYFLLALTIVMGTTRETMEGYNKIERERRTPVIVIVQMKIYILFKITYTTDAMVEWRAMSGWGESTRMIMDMDSWGQDKPRQKYEMSRWSELCFIVLFRRVFHSHLKMLMWRRTLCVFIETLDGFSHSIHYILWNTKFDIYEHDQLLN